MSAKMNGQQLGMRPDYTPGPDASHKVFDRACRDWLEEREKHRPRRPQSAKQRNEQKQPDTNHY